MKRGLVLFTALLAALLLEGKEFPVDGGILDVTEAPFHAAGDGVTDDTGALQAAIEAAGDSGRIVYLPAGTYLVSDTLAPPPDVFFLNIEGESRESTVIRLEENAEGFGDPLAPRPVLRTALAAAGWTNNSFMTNVADLTIEVGAGNPGASGILYIGNNQSSLRDLTLRSLDPEGAGAVAIDMAEMSLPGPGLVRNVRTEGFAYGVRLDHEQYGITLEEVEILQPRTAGIHVTDNLFMARQLTVETSGPEIPALVNANRNAMSILLDCSFLAGGSGEGTAIESDGFLYLRNVVENGYGTLLNDGGTKVVSIDGEYTSDAPVGLFPGAGRGLGLPVEEVPELPRDDPATWISVADFGAQPGTDSTAAIQAAIDAATTSAGTVYFPNTSDRSYLISDTIHVRGDIRRLHGMNARVKATAQLRATEKPMFLLGDGSAEWLVIEQFFVPWGTAGQHTLFENERSRNTLFRHIFATQDQFYRGLSASGKTHFVDVTAGHDGNDIGPVPLFHFGPEEQIWARQLNPEIFDGHITNEGGTVWIYGLKTEREGPIVTNRMGGRMEIIGGMIHPRNIGVPADMPVIINDQADLSFVGREANSNDTSYEILAKVRRQDEVRVLETLDAEVPLAVAGSRYSFVLPLFSEYGAAASPVRGALASRKLGPDRIRIRWDAVENAETYRIYRDTTWIGKERVFVGETAETEFSDTGLPVGAQFWYWIEPVVAGTGAGLSSAVSGLTARGLPAPPERLSASHGEFDDRIRIEWDLVQGADFYYLWRNTEENAASAERITTITRNDILSYVDEEVDPGQVYHYWIQPFAYGFGFGEYSEPAHGLAGQPEEWAGYPYVDGQGHVNTKSFLGWLLVREPFVYSYALEGWVYLPEQHVSDAGAWLYRAR